ncbi:hypothetical protein HID58_057145 [Brassica napus]|uniref:Uncharacterized protein n=1 Tax=Brassica napus TaxID=3708 RepID=A0ABQ8AQ92_BRANA|nr:hypothetical protein HID58_057145 [Brassica napus]
MRQSNVKCKSSTVTSTIHVSKAVTTIYQATHINTRQGCLRCRCLSCVTAPKPRSHFVDPYPLSVFLGEYFSFYDCLRTSFFPKFYNSYQFTFVSEFHAFGILYNNLFVNFKDLSSYNGRKLPFATAHIVAYFTCIYALGKGFLELVNSLWLKLSALLILRISSIPNYLRMARRSGITLVPEGKYAGPKEEEAMNKQGVVEMKANLESNEEDELVCTIGKEVSIKNIMVSISKEKKRKHHLVFTPSSCTL